MSNHNYSQYYSNKKKKNNKPKLDSVETTTSVEAPVEVAEVKMEAIEPIVVMGPIEVVEPVLTEETTQTFSGTIYNCTKLNVRVKPTIDADVLAILDVDSEIEVDPARSTNEWVKIVTAAGVEGFCMRKFVKL